jgi:hypothetical protein
MEIIVGDAAEHAHAADRFAREIRAIFERDSTRSRRLMRRPLGAQARERGSHPRLD